MLNFGYLLHYFLQNELLGSPCSPRDSQESSPTPQFKTINSSALSFLHSPTLTSIHDQWKTHSLTTRNKSRTYRATVKSIRYMPSHRNINTSMYVLVAQSCPTLCGPMNRSMPGLPVHHQLQEFTETHVHQVSDTIQPSHPRSSTSPPAPNPSQHQSLFQ